MREFGVLSDEPMSSPTSFGFDRVVQTMTDCIVSVPQETPFNICLSGGWGAGKTSVLRGVEASLRARDEGASSDGTRFVPLWFEPWKLGAENEVRDVLAHVVVDHIQEDANFLTGARLAVDRKNVVRVVAERLGNIRADDLSIAYRLESATRGTFKEIDDLFRRIAETYADDGLQQRRLVILVDDLDRCRPGRVVEVLETIRLFFGLPGFTFVFALDRLQVEEAILEAYPRFARSDAQVYLEKIFQLTYRLPRKASEELSSFLEAELDKIGLGGTPPELIRALTNAHGRNLRNLKLFINNVAFQRALLSDETEPEVNEILLKWLYLESALPESLALSLRRNSVELVIALEFLGSFCHLGNESRAAKYLGRLGTDRAQCLGAIVESLSRPELDVAGSAASDGGTLPSELIEMLRVEGSVAEALAVFSSGDQFFIDHDVARIVYLTRAEEYVVSGVVSPEESDRSGDSAELVAATGRGGREWNQRGDVLRKDNNDLHGGFAAYLLGVACQPRNAIYLADLGRTLRMLGHPTTAGAVFRRAWEVGSETVYSVVEIAYFFDMTLRETELATMLYWHALKLGTTTSSVRVNLSNNLKNLARDDADAKLALCAAVDAFRVESTDARRKIVTLRQLPDVPAAPDGDQWDASWSAYFDEVCDLFGYPVVIPRDDLHAVTDRLADFELLGEAFPAVSRFDWA
jgi:hypothetical protein